MSDISENVDLAFIVTALNRLITEVATLRDDMKVMAAILQRLDNDQDRMLQEIRAMPSQHDRVAARVKQLEDRPH